MRTWFHSLFTCYRHLSASSICQLWVCNSTLQLPMKTFRVGEGNKTRKKIEHLTDYDNIVL